MAQCILVTGSRTITNRDAVWAEMDRLHAQEPIELVIHGDCESGADSYAAQWAGRRGIALDPHPARWSDVDGLPAHLVRYDRRGRRYNVAAGPMRNTEMLHSTDPTKVVAFMDKRHPRGTPGTNDLLGKARALRDAGRSFEIVVIPV